MGEGPGPVGEEVVAGQVAEIIVTLGGGAPGRRGSGYRVRPDAVLTAAHVVDGAAGVRVRFDADLPTEWSAEVLSCWADPNGDLAVLSIASRGDEPAVRAARFGRIGAERAAVLAARAVGFPAFKLRTGGAGTSRYRDSHQAEGSVAVLSNRREGTLELTVPPPERDPDPARSPWEGMSGAALWSGGRIIGVIAEHHRSDGPGRLAAVRLDTSLAGLDPARQADLRGLLGLPDALPDAVPASPAEWVHTAYQAQVRDIAPDRLLDREGELDELVTFCAGDEPYAWWQAGPWAGKSALMSWFVLNPPTGVDVVSFFVTARLAGQSDSDACTEALTEQLAALAGESPTTQLTAGARRGTMLRLLDDAARRARESGRRLLLVIDGLDEDGSTASPSIAALLPRRPPPQVRVLVASRPHPPIPDDVAEDHPLRRLTSRRLEVSEHARGMELRAKHELAQLLAGSPLQRDVLGFITAAGGGLTLDDLEQLTRQPPYAISALLGGLFGRSVGGRISPLATGRPDQRVYLFTHETLRLVAEEQFGGSLAAYRERLMAWADTWRQRGWPARTPDYLLRSYPRMLAGHGDLARLVSCTTDPSRHDRMREITGGDAVALTEIGAAQQHILARADPDLAGLALLAVEQERLTDRNRDVPAELPAVWATLGEPARAEALAHSIPEPDRHTVALTGLAEVAAGHGDRAGAVRLAEQAAVSAARIGDPGHRVEALARLIETMTASGDDAQAARLAGTAEALIGEITEPDHRAAALARLARALAGGADPDRGRAARLVTEAENVTAQLADPNLRLEASVRLAEAVAEADGDGDGDGDGRAVRLVEAAEACLGRIDDRGFRTAALARLAEAVATAGDPHRAHALAGQVADPSWRVEALARVIETATRTGDRDWAARLADEGEEVAGRITDPGLRLEALARLAEAAVTGGGVAQAASQAAGQAAGRAVRLADAAAGLIGRIADPSLHVQALTRLARALAGGADPDRAGRLAETAEGLTSQLNEPNRRLEALAALAKALYRGGEDAWAARLAGKAEALAAGITEPNRRSEALTALADVVARGGDRDWAGRLVDEAETLSAQIIDPSWRVWMVIWLAEVAAACGDPERAARLAAEAGALTTRVGNPYRRLVGLAFLAEAVAVTDPAWARRLTGEAERLIEQITDPSRRVWGTANLAEATTALGDLDWTVRLATSAMEGAAQATDQPVDPAGLAAMRSALDMVAALRPPGAAVAQVLARHSGRGVLARLAVVVAVYGGLDQAHGFTARITDPYRRADGLACLAAMLLDTHPLDEVRSRARRLLAEALATGSWINVVADLGRLDPPAVRTLVGELQVRWNLPAG